MHQGLVVYEPPVQHGRTEYAAPVGCIREICWDALEGWICTLVKDHPSNHKALDIEYRLCAEWLREYGDEIA